MKTQSTNFFAQISKADLINLTVEVKETLAVHLLEKNGKILSAADVWNIQRNKKSRIQRRYSI